MIKGTVMTLEEVKEEMPVSKLLQKMESNNRERVIYISDYFCHLSKKHMRI